jgi:hypothetical protein
MTGSMAAHARPRELAAIALDFPLEPAEQAELEAHAADCAACRAFASALRRDIAAVAALPELDAPARVRRRVLGEPVRSGPRRGILAPLAQAAMLVIGIAPAVLFSLFQGAGAQGQPSLQAEYRGETTFEATGEERVVRVTVSLDAVAAATAESAFVSTWPALDLATHEHPYGSHPLAIVVRQVGPDGPLPGTQEVPGFLDVSACRARPGEPCLLDVELRLTWTGPASTTAAWELQAHVSFAFGDSEAIKKGARVEIVATDATRRLPAIVLAGLGAGLLAAILAARRLAATAAGGRVRRLAARAPLVLAVALLAGAGWLVAATGGVRVVAYEQTLAILLAAQAAALFGAHARRSRDRGLAENLTIGSVAFGSLPVIVLTVTARQAYQPIGVLALVATLTFVVAATVLVREPLASPSNGRPLTVRQRVLIEAWVAFATVMAFAGVVLGVFSWGWNAWFAGLDPSQAPLIVLAFLSFVAIRRWLNGGSRMLTLLGTVLAIDSSLVFVVSLVRRLGAQETLGAIVADWMTDPLGIALIGSFAFGVIAILGRRLRPDSDSAP